MSHLRKKERNKERKNKARNKERKIGFKKGIIAMSVFYQTKKIEPENTNLTFFVLEQIN